MKLDICRRGGIIINKMEPKTIRHLGISWQNSADKKGERESERNKILSLDECIRCLL